jgi:predicted membrane-bound spermidine synthase
MTHINRSAYFYLGVFMISGLLMALQILMSRIFSVTTWYHLAFLVISVAMFGMTLAALSVYKGNEISQRNNHAALMAKACGRFGWTIVLALGVQLCIPIVNSGITESLTSLPIVSAAIVLPFYFAGQILSLALTRAPYAVERTYGVDLLGAAGGCLFALALMSFVDAPSGVLLLSALAFVCAWLFAKSGDVAVSLKKTVPALGLALLAAVNIAAPHKVIYPFIVKGEYWPQSKLSHDEWNSISRVTVSSEQKNVRPFYWGASRELPQDLKASYYALTIDGDAATPINQFDGDLKDARFLEYDVTTIAYALPGLEKGAIIGVGGGRDALTALYFGLKDITALDINNVQISLLKEKEPFRSYAGLADRPEVKLINTEARSWFARSPDRFDIIQMSLIDTWAATGAGAFALSENGLYTVDALKVFLEDLKDHGVLTVSRWHAETGENEMQRLLAMAVEALIEEGAANPSQHIFVAKGSMVATLVLSKSPFTRAQLTALRGQVSKRGFEILADPAANTLQEHMRAIVFAKNSEELAKATASDVYDLSPPRDTRPFFFNMVRLSNPATIFKLALGNEVGSVLGHARATLNLFFILGFTAFMVGFVILWPLRKALAESSPCMAQYGTLWFFLIGLGFMLAEIALVQRMSVFLGHPVYSLGIVLFSLILSTGAGSLLSERVVLSDARRKIIWAIMTAGVMIAMPFALSTLFGIFAEAGLFMRAVVCVMISVPLGVLLGYGFPTGMKMAQARDSAAMPWFWGINGAAGVFGSVLAVALNIALGLNATMMIAGLCYGLLAIPSAMLARR